MVAGGSTTGTFQVLRSKGVASVSNPLTGYFCIKPNSTTMNLGRIVPSVTVDSAKTSASDTVAVWSSLNIGCPKGTIEVQTFQSSTHAARNQTGFTLVVI
jgi:hypothetical protein